jgi:hypothetical protein
MAGLRPRGGRIHRTPVTKKQDWRFCAGIVGSVGNNDEGGAGIAWRMHLVTTKGG